MHLLNSSICTISIIITKEFKPAFYSSAGQRVSESHFFINNIFICKKKIYLCITLLAASAAE